MTNSTLTVIGPGDGIPDEGRAVMLVDDQCYPAERFTSVATTVETGASVVLEGDGYRLSESARTSLSRIHRVNGHALFFASDDTHVNTFLRIAPYCYRYTFVVHKTLDLGARAALDAKGIAYQVHGRILGAFAEADIAVMGNDNGKEERLFIHHCRRFSIPVVSLQEAVNLDFDGPRMRWTDRTFVGGTHALQYHARILTVLTGNPRYDDIRPKPKALDPYVLINSNFTFGVAHGWSRAWLDQVIAACDRAGMAYRVTVHPRDETDLSGVEHVMDSSAFVVHKQIAGAFVLVSRDSSLPYEALLLNRHVVYYNPFGEQERCLNEDDTGLIEKCVSVDALAEQLTALASRPSPLDEKAVSEGMFQHYFTGRDGKNYLRVLRAMQTFIDHDYLGRSDASADSYFVAWTQVWLQNVIRPQLRSIGVLREVWKFFKYGVFRIRQE